MRYFNSTKLLATRAIGLAIAVCWCAVPAWAQTARPLSDVLENWESYSYAHIKDVAATEAANDGPHYPNAPTAVPAYENFEGNFTPAATSTKLAIFSDDGCDVYIEGTKVYSGKGQGQALPDLSQSLHKISFDFAAGQSYLIRVEYSNTSYQGAADIDGASLFVYSDSGVPSLLLSSNHPSIVAGGWDDSRQAYEYLEKKTDALGNTTTEWKPREAPTDPHIATLTATLNDSEGHAMAGKTVTFKWDMPGPALAETRTAVTDSNGKAKVKVISGDEVSDSSVEVKATYQDLSKSENLNVLAPTVQWQYKNENGNYVSWNGDIWGLYPLEHDTNQIPLRALLTFNDTPVVGHPVSWGLGH